MTSINVFQFEADLIWSVADKNDMTAAEVVEMLCDYMEDMCRDNHLET